MYKEEKWGEGKLFRSRLPTEEGIATKEGSRGREPLSRGLCHEEGHAIQRQQQAKRPGSRNMLGTSEEHQERWHIRAVPPNKKQLLDTCGYLQFE